MIIEITMEKTMRVCKIFEVTEEQLQYLESGDNIFQEELERELDSGDIEYDYTVNDEYGRTIVAWDRY